MERDECRNLYPVGWGCLIPPYLHLMLGLANDEVQKIYKELQAIDGIDKEAAQRLSDVTVVAAEVEDELIDNPVVASTFGSNPNLGKCVEDKPFGTWGFLADEAKSKAAASSAAGAALDARTLHGNNQKLSTRQLKANHESAVKMENEDTELRAGADALYAAKDAVFAARAAVEAEEVA
jgi:hypothetical protein